MKYVRTKDKILKVDETGYVKEIDVCGNKCLFLFNKNYLYGREVIKQADSIEELCDCFIIKYVESHTFSAYNTYEEARYVYEHDKQNTTCILYGVIETETALNYVARVIDYKGELVLLCQN